MNELLIGILSLGLGIVIGYCVFVRQITKHDNDEFYRNMEQERFMANMGRLNIDAELAERVMRKLNYSQLRQANIRMEKSLLEYLL